jgi:nuclease S1
MGGARNCVHLFSSHPRILVLVFQDQSGCQTARKSTRPCGRFLLLLKAEAKASPPISFIASLCILWRFWLCLLSILFRIGYTAGGREVRRQKSLGNHRVHLPLRIANVVLAVPFCPVSAWGWGSDGHRIVANIAADNLTLAAQSHVANILGVPTYQVAAAMEAASVRPDSEFREEDRATAPWHFIDICLQDRREDVSTRCPGGNCVTGKGDEYSRRLKEGKYDQWGAAGDLAFLIHFVGDLHQPLHAANDADRGGNCVMVDSHPRARNLHDAWDTAMVGRLEGSGGTPESTAQRLEQTYANEKTRDVWIPEHTDDIAWESNQIARSDIYVALQIPVQPCEPPAAVCSNKPEVDLTSAYMDGAEIVAGPPTGESRIQVGEPLERDMDAADYSRWEHREAHSIFRRRGAPFIKAGDGSDRR